MDNKERELLRRQLTDEIRDAVEKELKRRYTWLGLIAIIFTSGAITLIVDNLLKSAHVELHSAKRVQELASVRLTTAAEKAEEIISKAESAERRIESAEQKINILPTRIESSLTELERKTNSAISISSDLQKELEKVNRFIKSLAVDQRRTDEKTRAFVAQIAEVQESLDRSGKQISQEKTRAKEFVAAKAVAIGNWFPVIFSIYEREEAFSKAKQLKKGGLKFEVEVYTAADKYGKQVYAITLGGYLTKEQALERVEYAKNKGIAKDAYVWESSVWGQNLL